jgi:hypothetical protein
MGVVYGPVMLSQAAGPAMESHYRYLSGLLFGIGLMFLTTVPTIERSGHLISILSSIVVAGGLARLYGVYADGNPGAAMLCAVVMELGVVPILWLWQRRIARRCKSALSHTLPK